MAQNDLFNLFDERGNRVTYEFALESFKDTDIIFFGEYHDQPICHWLQMLLLKDLHKIHGSSLFVGVEMFETDNQILIEEYFNGLITQKKFEEEARLWNNYKSDYKQMLEYAKKENISFVGTNAPGRYVNSVYNNGLEILDKISNTAKSYIPELPIHYDPEIACYKKMLEMGMGHGGHNLPKAQALRDATMAWSIAQNLTPGKKAYHINGSYHSDYHEGIIYYLKRINPDFKIKVISTVYQPFTTILSEDNFKKGDIILCIREDMTRSY